MIVAFVATAFAGPVQDRLDDTLDQIHATSDQRSRIEAELESARATFQSFRQEAGDLREQIHQALFGPTVDRAALEEDREALVDLFDRVTRAAFDVMADGAEILTPEQRARLHEIRDQRISERWSRWR